MLAYLRPVSSARRRTRLRAIGRFKEVHHEIHRLRRRKKIIMPPHTRFLNFCFIQVPPLQATFSQRQSEPVKALRFAPTADAAPAAALT